MQPEALPADPQAYNELCDKLAALSLPLANGQLRLPRRSNASGKTYKLESNHLKLESVAIQFGDDAAAHSSCATNAASTRYRSATPRG